MTGNQLQKFDGTQGGDLAQSSGGMMSTQASRQAAEVQAAMVIAKHFPRDIVQAERRIAVACQRTGLAQQAFYSYPKGGTKVSGPSIRMAEMLAQSWGNMESGIVELERRENESTVMAFAWDYESNTRETKTFTVPHEMKAKGQIKKLTDPREIYEHIANMGARRRRSCILGIIPVDVQDNAVALCQKTLAGQGGGKPLIDRVKEWVIAFERFGVTPEHIEKRLGHKIQATDPTELVNLRGIWQSINDGMSKREDWFEIEESPAGGDELKSGRSKPKKGRPKKKAAEAAAPEPEPEPESQTAPDPMEESKTARQEAGEFFDKDLGGGAKQDDRGPATETDLSLVEQLANMKLGEAGAEQTDRNRYRVKSFACMGEDIKEINSPTHGEARTIVEQLKGLTKSDVKEAVEAD